MVSLKDPITFPPEFMLHCGLKCRNSLQTFYSCCLFHQSIPKIWWKATIIALPKPNKPVDNPRIYRLILLLCVPFKLLEQLLLAQLEPVVDPQLPNKQVGFRRGCSTVHQIIKLTCDMEDNFEKGHKAGVILVDLTSAYHATWLQRLMLSS